MLGHYALVSQVTGAIRKNEIHPFVIECGTRIENPRAQAVSLILGVCSTASDATFVQERA